MTAIAILINKIMYSHRNLLEEGLMTSFVLASERSLACRLLSLLTAVAVLLLSAVVAWRLMPLMTTFVPTLFGESLPAPERGEERLVRLLSAQEIAPLMSGAESICPVLSSASDTCGTDSGVNTMLSIWITMF